MKFNIFFLILFICVFRNNNIEAQNFKNPSYAGHDFADSLVKAGVDTVLLGIYRYNNGVLPHKQFVYWEKSGLKRTKIFDVGVNSISKSFLIDTLNLFSEINFYVKTRIDTMVSSINTTKKLFDGMQYSITLFLPNMKHVLYVMDYERKENTIDYRCQFVNMLDKRLKSTSLW